jgi:hypothetical protein
MKLGVVTVIIRTTAIVRVTMKLFPGTRCMYAIAVRGTDVTVWGLYSLS